MKDSFDQLMKRPAISEIDTSYQSMFQAIRERLVAEVGVAEWVPDREPVAGTACAGEISSLDGAEKRNYGAGSSRGNLPDARWDEAVTIVAEIARKHGFGAPEVITDGPGDHEVSFRDTFDGQLVFGTGANTVLSAYSGCHLSDEAQRRGTYLPPNTY